MSIQPTIPSPSPDPTRRDPRATLCVTFLAVAFGYHLYSALQGWNRPIADFNPWRQSQTALTAWYFLRDGFSLAYPLPVLGPPWSVPFEFPAYQWLVALTTQATGLPLETSGRTISLLAFYATLPAVNLLLRDLLQLKSERFFVLAFVLLSPVYISWSRAFSIESTALALALWYLVWFHRWTIHPSIHAGVLLAAFAILAALTKITTLFTFAAAALLVLVTATGTDPNRWKANASSIGLGVALAFVLPLAAATAWVAYGDNVKISGALSGSLTSSALTPWNYGDLEQRLSVSTWRQFEFYTRNLVVSRYTLLLALLCLTLFAVHRRRIAVLTGLFVLPVLVFTNLYFVHDYYWYANGFFILVALGLAFAPLVSLPAIPLATGVVACTLVFYQYRNTFNIWYGPTQRQTLSPLLPLAGKIREFTAPDDYCVVYGLYWDPTLAYHSQRRMIMETAAQPAIPLDSPPLATAIAQAGRERLGAVVFVGAARSDATFVQAQLSHLGITGGPSYEDDSGALYLAPSL